ncbi:hypothetical protein F5X99DRAFT_378076 [Biscogniauxia marginata]|nr:hypothetical protein F5X99DRAFT_378076 [Biscogniauxia marginata]
MAPSRRGRSLVTHRLLPFSASTTSLQAATYLLGISLFSISFLVFLNSAISFVITDLLGVKSGVGDIVGTLGFVDEIVALVACPVWGLLSDRLGVRWVAVLGYAIIAISLWAFVQVPGGSGEHGYPGLVAARIVFALGATAAATMVTAILPVLTADDNDDRGEDNEGDGGEEADIPEGGDEDEDERRRKQDARRSIAISLESDMTITPERFTRNLSSDRRRFSNASLERENEASNQGKRPSTLAGYVGLFTGCGALVALVLFLPLPTQFSEKEGVTPARAITDSFYVVAVVALLVALFVFFGLRGLRGEEDKGWRMLLNLRRREDGQQDNDYNTSTATDSYPNTIAYTETSAAASNLNRALSHNKKTTQQATYGNGRPLPYRHLLLTSLRLGVTDPDIALGYLGGFVARAGTVAISLFVPLYVNAYFISNGFCTGSPNDPSPELKKECRAAYVLASMLGGVAQLVALLCAPVFGWVSGNIVSGGRGGGVNWGVTVAALFGIVGYVVFPRLRSPEYKDVDGRGGSAVVFLVAAMLGVSQIGAIVCSLGSLGRGVVSGDSFDAGTGTTGTATTTTPRDRDAEDNDVGNDGGHGDDDNDDDDGGSGDDNTYREQDRAETQALLENGNSRKSQNRGGAGISRVQLKGSIAGVYSWCGGAAILLLTKLGGYLFDAASHGAPFYLMAGFNGALLTASLAVDFGRGKGRGTGGK